MNLWNRKSLVATKSTKNEILAAYEDLLQKVQEKKTEEPKKIQERQKQKTIVKSAAELSYECIEKEAADRKVNLSSVLDKLGSSFVSEFRKFEELQQAVGLKQKNLEYLYQLLKN